MIRGGRGDGGRVRQDCAVRRVGSDGSGTVMVALLPAVIVPRLQGKAAQPPCEELTVTPVSCRGQCVIDGNGLGIGRSGIADRDVVSEATGRRSPGQVCRPW